MINKDYKLVLEQIEQQLESHQYAEAHENIEWLKGLKPIPLKLNVLEARYHLVMENYEKVTECLDNKWKPDYGYDGLADAMQVYEDLWNKLGDKKEAGRYRYTKLLVQYMGTDTQQWRECQDFQNQLETLGRAFYEKGDHKVLKELADTAYIMSDAVWYAVIQQYFCASQTPDVEIPTQEWIERLPNMGWAKKQLEQSGRCVIIAAEDHNLDSCKAMARMLSEIEKRVYLITPPVLWESTDEDIVMAQESFRLQEKDVHGICFVPSFYLEVGPEQRLDNRAAVIASLLQLEEIDGLALAIASGNLANDLEIEEVLKKQYSRFNLGLGDVFESTFSIGWAGDYRQYISTIYNCDVRKWMKQDAACRYSIVISASDSVGGLRHTLKTCLEVDYPKEQYEVVISDGSMDGNNEIRHLCESFNDSRIQYYRTPQGLSLAKRFEYGFLQTKGEFLFSLGAGDAVLPWIFQVLDDVQEQYPKEMVIQWHRSFYAHPDFGHQKADRLEIPEEYQWGEYGINYVTRMQYMRNLLQNPQMMYGLPLLHVNSGCKRQYLRNFLNETGRLWDGEPQDVYIGVINVLINNQILNLRYPLAIDGMTNMNHAQSLSSYNTDREKQDVGACSMSMTERLLPDFTDSDAAGLYHSLLRAAARGVLPKAYIAEIFDWKKMFLDCAVQLNARNPEFDKLIHSARYTASWHGEAFLEWFDDTIYEPIIQPTRYEEEKIDKLEQVKTYAEAEMENGGRIVDASNFSVENIYDAVQLFIKLTGLSAAEGN